MAARGARANFPRGPARNRTVIIHLYTIMWNEAPLLPYFLKHYGRFCDRMFIYDNGSDDGSQAIAKQHPRVELRTIDSGGQLTQETLLAVKDQEWKQSRGRADWVICCDIDELLWHRDLTGFLFACRDRGISIPVPAGIQMVADDFPAGDGQLYDQVVRGFFDPLFRKYALFDARDIEEIGYTAGCHVANPRGRVKLLNDPAFKLLHFKFLGLPFLTERYAALYGRQSESDRRDGQSWGYQYSWPPQEIARRFEHFRKIAEPVEGLA